MDSSILIIEDDESIRSVLKLLLGDEGYKVIEAENGEKGLELFSQEIDLVVLDIMLPGISGYQVCEEIRKSSVVPILFLSAKTQNTDKLTGLMLGGDDYLTKPFSFMELQGRITALLRRYKEYSFSPEKVKTDMKSEWISYRNLSIHKYRNEILINGEEVELQKYEYNIFLLLAKYPNKIFSAQNIYESVWKEPYFYNCNATVMVHISKLRKVLSEKLEGQNIIKTVWGKGYKLEVF